MKRTLIIYVCALAFFQACGSSNDSNNPAAPAPGQPPAENPTQPTGPGTGQPESANFFSYIDRAVTPSSTGDKLIAERFYVVMAKVSVYSLICDFKNEKGWSAQVSKLWNSSTKLQTLAEKVFGGEKPAYNRFEKQRNIESKRLSFESGPNACALGEASFHDYADLTAAELSTIVTTTPRGNL